ncbi:alpha-L-rhamnosidase-related protein [Marinoscillum furvescens]|uniref:Alpha-L-rhamnosidase six-hairpin glycosidase domain-containing protein n=1 Tax=Marinoscillum furvescens DSM 4134 TaxID=1122208 RepID=A0A3D9KZW7_MARFU|nr:glycogen debranching protein [Marinoscillum furvescens]RED92825.1 hypothetical protein C7460_12842 [Marinoscillum furvescens DSM 4134]
MKWIVFALLAGLVACNSAPKGPKTLSQTLADLPSVTGKSDYLSSPYVAAGDRLYVVGHQDGTFPDLGWHVTGEMGGIWNHPIKLLDGFALSITQDSTYCLPPALQFINYPLANQHIYQLPDFEVVRTQFVPDSLEGVVVEYLFRKIKTSQKLNVSFTALIDLRPVWLADSLNIQDGADQVSFDIANGLLAKDSLNPWYVAVKSSVESAPRSVTACANSRRGKGVDASLNSTLMLNEGKETVITYYIGGSYQSEDAAHETLNHLSTQSIALLTKKKAKYEKLTQTAKLSVPDERIEQMYRWTKYNTDWLMRDVPEIGRGLSAGIPDYPWWFGTDNTYALQGLLATGQHQEVKNTLQLIIELSGRVNDNGKIMHEASTNGVVFNPGNLNTTPYFIHLLWKYYLWTGDLAFLQKHYQLVKDGLLWVESQDKDGNGFPDGAGMMEIHGLHSEMIDVVAYTQAAYAAASNMAELFGEPKLAAQYAAKATLLKEEINTTWWVADANSFADFRATRAQAIKLIDDAIVRADTINKPWAIAELQRTQDRVARLRDNRTRGFVVHHNWVVNTPMEIGIADPEKAKAALVTARNYTNKFGMYVTGIDRDENQEQSSKWKAFSYVGAVMTLPTGVQAIAEARYGRPEHSLAYLKMLANGFSYALPGSMYEVSPDYGMIAQAWNSYAVATPIIEHLFGIEPNAGEKRITITPNFPPAWQQASIANVKIGDNSLTIEKNGSQLSIKQTLPDWTITVKTHNGQATLSTDKIANKKNQVSFSGTEKIVHL